MDEHEEVLWVMVHRLENGETSTALKRGEPEVYPEVEARRWLSLVIDNTALHPFGYTPDMGLYGPLEIVGESMHVVDSFLVRRKGWAPPFHDSMRYRLGHYD